jgi:HAD superfamily hydrolase (TIGR01549 family)
MVRAVLFDLDDTLFDHAGCSRDALIATQARDPRLGALPITELERAHSTLLEELHGEVMLGRVPLHEARLERFRRLLVHAGGAPGEDLVEQIAATYRDRYKEVRRAMRGATELLTALRRHAKLAIVSNNLLDEQIDKLRVCRLDTLLDAVVVSERAGVSKPDPQIFAIALNELGVHAEEAVMVGDSWKADVEGARAAGVRPIWFNPQRRPAPEEGTSVAQLFALEPTTEALDLILGNSGER